MIDITGMKEVGQIWDYERKLILRWYRPYSSNPIDQTTEYVQRYHVLTLWHEAGKPIPFVVHLGPFIKIEEMP